MPEAFRDYRVRLAEMGYDIRGMRGMGATESNVNKSSLRLKKRGQSWCPEGLRSCDLFAGLIYWRWKLFDISVPGMKF
ncbi:MAG: UPF0236 family protein [Firmicutes bacterium]|nr:UPF0236 family protein [Candidatus Fermentithermobacillaceae bacterium]